MSNRLDSVTANFVTPPLGDVPPDSKSSRTASNGPSQPEYCEDYPLVVAHLSDGTRVIECRDGIQWIIQTHCSGSIGGKSFDFIIARMGKS